MSQLGETRQPHLPAVVAEKALDEATKELAPAAVTFAEKVSDSPAAELGELFADKIGSDAGRTKSGC